MKYILRNHIYRYTVEELSSQLNVRLEVLPWDLHQESEVNFENVKVAENISWNKKTKKDEDGNPVENGSRVDEEKGIIYMMPGIDDYVEATFKLTAPVGAKWYASLVSLNQDHHDSFGFYDGYSSGIIDGSNPQTIRIRNLQEKVYQENNEARLVITVEYPDKTQKEVYVTGETAFDNYRLVQEITEIMG